MKEKPYYMAYENRYRKIYEAGVERWGYSPEDKELVRTLTLWVEENQLKGKQIIEFACGEGAAGVILAKLGCIYHGVDIAPSAVEKSRITLRNYPNAIVSLLNMVNQQVSGKYDAALDVMGFHMLVTDFDRTNYLQNAYACLKSGAPMLFFRESYRRDAFEGDVNSFDDWLTITGDDYEKPQQRFAESGDNEIEVFIPLIPARAKTQDGYVCEMTKIGFVVDLFQEMAVSKNIINSASIYVHKP